MERALFKVKWGRTDDGWSADLLLAGPDGIEERSLAPGAGLELEIHDQRRCVGYAAGPGDRRPCPGFRQIQAGSQCQDCARQDIYASYVRGHGTDLGGSHTVYAAQCGDTCKVGVTRRSDVEERWIEQGADFAAVLAEDLDGDTALEREQELTDRGLAQRIRKEDKATPAREDRLSRELEELGIEADVEDLRDRTVYPAITCGGITRTGPLTGEVRSVKGHIISNSRLCMACTSGRLVTRPEQQGLGRFGD